MKNNPKESPFRQLILLWVLLGVFFLGIAVFSVVSPRLQPAPPTPSPTSSATASSEPAPTPTADDAQTFHGYACSPDCSELESGYGYAEANKITSRGDCPSGSQFSQSYTQGCWAYADEHQSP
jgi:hypothetical protein